MRNKQDTATHSWENIEKLLEENTGSSYKVACIEAEKLFKHKVSALGYSTKNMDQLLTLFGWKLSNLEGLKKAIKKTHEIKESHDYTLISFEAEDAVAAFKQAAEDLGSKKPLSLQRRLNVFWQNYISIKSSFSKKFIISFFVFFLIIKLLASTEIGKNITAFMVKAANFIYSWSLLLAILGVVLLVFTFSFFMLFEKKNIKIKDSEK